MAKKKKDAGNTAVAEREQPVTDQPAAESVSPELAAFLEGAADELIDINLIDPSPYQTRKRFDEEKLQRMAGSLRKHGQLQNLIVRFKDGRYELVVGERRLRAGKIADLTQMRCQVIQCTDNEARELVIIENLEREDVSAVEEAAGFQQLIQTGQYSQTSLAVRLGFHPSYVSNRLRLLTLPADWQAMIIDGRLPPTHARVLVAWTDRPEVLEYLQSQVSVAFADLTVSVFEDSIIKAAHNLSRSVDPDFWDGPKFEVTEYLLKRLDVMEVREIYSAKKVNRAFNVTLWEELQAEAAEAMKAASEAEDSDDDDESEIAEVSRPIPGYQLVGHCVKHVGAVLSSRLKEAMALRLLIASSTEENLEPFVRWLHAKAGIGTDDIPDESDGWAVANKLNINGKNVCGLAHEYVTTALAQNEFYVSLPLLMTICDELGFDPFEKWQPEKELLEMCSVSQLRELFTDQMAPEKSVKKWGRERLIKEALGNWPPGYFPVLLKPHQLLSPAEQQTQPGGEDSELIVDDGPDVNECPHGALIGECEQCDAETSGEPDTEDPDE